MYHHLTAVYVSGTWVVYLGILLVCLEVKKACLLNHIYINVSMVSLVAVFMAHKNLMYGAYLICYIIYLLLLVFKMPGACETNKIRLKTLNVRGYLSAVPYLRHLLKEADILCIYEHWLFDNRHYILSDISSTHYVYARSSSACSSENFGQGRGQGGVAIFWRKDLAAVSVVSDIIHDRVCAIRLQTGNGTIVYIFSVYMPAQGCNENLGACLDELSEILDSREEGSWCIIAGDFNGGIGNCNGVRSGRAATRQGLLVAQFLRRHNLLASNQRLGVTGPIHTFESHNAKTTLDYIMVPAAIEDWITESWVGDWHYLNSSDHLPVSADLYIRDTKSTAELNIGSDRIRWDKNSNRL